MKDRQQIDEDIRRLEESLKQYNLFDDEKGHAMLQNVRTLQKYAEDNDLWEDYCWASEESVIYTCMYTSLDVNFKTAELIKDPTKFYDYVKTWFEDKADHYMQRANKGTINPDKIGEIMCKDCANELLEVLHESEEEE